MCVYSIRSDVQIHWRNLLNLTFSWFHQSSKPCDMTLSILLSIFMSEAYLDQMLRNAPWFLTSETETRYKRTTEWLSTLDLSFCACVPHLLSFLQFCGWDGAHSHLSPWTTRADRSIQRPLTLNAEVYIFKYFLQAHVIFDHVRTLERYSLATNLECVFLGVKGFKLN